MAGNANFNEIGYPIRINLGFDISATTPILVLLPEVGRKRDIPATVPNVNVIVGDETLVAGEYIEYITKDKDLDYVGRWKFKAKLEFSSTDIRQTDYQKFRVLS